MQTNPPDWLPFTFSLCSIYSSLGLFNCQICFLDGKINLQFLHSVPLSSLMCCSNNLIHICLSTPLPPPPKKNI